MATLKQPVCKQCNSVIPQAGTWADSRHVTAYYQKTYCNRTCLGKSRVSDVKSLNPRIYRIWKNMRNRCNNTNNPSYKDYGGRGIRVCERWNVFKNFYEDMKMGYADDLTIERIDVNGNYEPTNCKWVTKQEQSTNKRNSVKVVIGNEVKTLTEWARELGLKRSTASMRYYKYGWPINKILGVHNAHLY